MHWKRYRSWLIPLLIVAVIKIFSFFPEAVEKYYSTGIYPFISIFPRLAFGWRFFYTWLSLSYVFPPGLSKELYTGNT
jgi:hypothetical protein